MMASIKAMVARMLNDMYFKIEVSPGPVITAATEVPAVADSASDSLASSKTSAGSDPASDSRSKTSADPDAVFDSNLKTSGRRRQLLRWGRGGGYGRGGYGGGGYRHGGYYGGGGYGRRYGPGWGHRRWGWHPRPGGWRRW